MEKVEKVLLSEEYQKFWTKIEKGDNFTLMRMADGEHMLMNGRKIHSQEHWVAPNHITELGKALLSTLDMNFDNVYYGISCPCCDKEAYVWYMSRIKSKNITFSNIFVNCNYKQFIKDFSKLKRNAVVICNDSGKGKKIGSLNILDYFTVSNQCVDFFENHYNNFIHTIIEKYGHIKNTLFVVSAGPLSQLIITDLYKNNSQNTYIDFGSSIDCYIHGKDTRPYNNPHSEYAKRDCWMYNPKQINLDVSVILTVYKRPESLYEQCKAILSQSLKPKEIFLIKDGFRGNECYDIVIKENFLKNFSKVKICQKNCGVWERFRFANECNSKYICIFDDDTIPGRRWLENCFYESINKEGVYGTIGIMFEDASKYPCGGYYRVGWDGPFYKTLQVDFVGHSWFFKKDYLKYMFEDTKELQNLVYAGEDMALSFKCQQHHIHTFVPPHPIGNLELWGSKRDTALKFGQSSIATSANPIVWKKFNVAINMLVDKWKFIYQYNVIYVKKYKVLIYIYRFLYKISELFKKIKRKIKNFYEN